MPTIKHLKSKGYNVEGPFSADTIFTRDNQDLILAMFHDQALPVIKTLGFGNIVNTTLGLPIIRTSVDHGTALDIAGTSKANSDSLIEAIKTSINIVNQEMIEKIKPDKKLGQNFLINNFTINTLNEIINVNEEDLILEIGPGQGALTESIIKKQISI